MIRPVPVEGNSRIALRFIRARLLVLVRTAHPVTEAVSLVDQVISDQAKSRFFMAQVAAHGRAFGYADRLSAAFIIVVIFFIA